jgi:hypothetical protein
MGSAWGKGARESRKDKQLVLSEGKDNMGKDKEDWASRT